MLEARTPKWGDASDERKNGRFVKSVRCDCCGKPVGLDHYTDDEVCGGSDGPGFYVCGRKSCGRKLEGKSVEERRAIYTAGRARNEAEDA